jgi:hypothetical protein
MTGDDTVTSTIVWEGIEIEVTYAAKSILNRAHLELRIPTKESIPVTETGYRSEFLEPGLVEEQGGPAAYTRAWLDYMAGSREWQDYVLKNRQLSLF